MIKASRLLDQSIKDIGKDPSTQQFDALAASRLQWLKKHAEEMCMDAGSAFGKVEQDDALTLRAQEIAAHLGTRVNKVEVIEPVTGKPMINAGALPKGRIIVGRALIDTFTPEELDFILAHELAHIKCRHLVKMINRYD